MQRTGIDQQAMGRGCILVICWPCPLHWLGGTIAEEAAERRGRRAEMSRAARHEVSTPPPPQHCGWSRSLVRRAVHPWLTFATTTRNDPRRKLNCRPGRRFAAPGAPPPQQPPHNTYCSSHDQGTASVAFAMAPHSHLLWALLLLPTVAAAVDMLILKKWVSRCAGSSAAPSGVGVGRAPLLAAAHRSARLLPCCRMHQSKHLSWPHAVPGRPSTARTRTARGSSAAGRRPCKHARQRACPALPAVGPAALHGVCRAAGMCVIVPLPAQPC